MWRDSAYLNIPFSGWDLSETYRVTINNLRKGKCLIPKRDGLVILPSLFFFVSMSYVFYFFGVVTLTGLGASANPLILSSTPDTLHP